MTSGQLADFEAFSKMLIALERNTLERSAFGRSTEKYFLYWSTKLELKVSTRLIFDNPWSKSTAKTDQLDQYISSAEFYFPHISLSKGESRRSPAAFVREIFKKYRGELYFDVDSRYLSYLHRVLLWLKDGFFFKVNKLFLLRQFAYVSSFFLFCSILTQHRCNDNIREEMMKITLHNYFLSLVMQLSPHDSSCRGPTETSHWSKIFRHIFSNRIRSLCSV
jgi:hypothetical protein